MIIPVKAGTGLGGISGLESGPAKVMAELT